MLLVLNPLWQNFLDPRMEEASQKLQVKMSQVKMSQVKISQVKISPDWFRRGIKIGQRKGQCTSFWYLLYFRASETFVDML